MYHCWIFCRWFPHSFNVLQTLNDPQRWLRLAHQLGPLHNTDSTVWSLPAQKKVLYVSEPQDYSSNSVNDGEDKKHTVVNRAIAKLPIWGLSMTYLLHFDLSLSSIKRRNMKCWHLEQQSAGVLLVHRITTTWRGSRQLLMDASYEALKNGTATWN